MEIPTPTVWQREIEGYEAIRARMGELADQERHNMGPPAGRDLATVALAVERILKGLLYG